MRNRDFGVDYIATIEVVSVAVGDENARAFCAKAQFKKKRRVRRPFGDIFIFFLFIRG